MLDRIKRRTKLIKNQLIYLGEEKKVRRILKSDHKPIYHIHIRKTAGTTINFAFLTNYCSEDVEETYESMAKKSNHRIILQDKVFVGWNAHLINGGNYSYAFSHIPLHRLKLPSDIFLFTCLRDPVKRVISHYNMLRYYQQEGIDHASMRVDGKWLGGSFDDFLERIPREHLLNQIYMFSKKFDLEEAYDKLMGLDKVLYTEDLVNGLADLESMLKWPLPISNQKKYGYKSENTPDQLHRLREALEPEYQLLDRLKESS